MVESKKTQAAVIVFLLVCALFVLRAVVVGVYQIRMADAIYVYQLDCMDNDQQPLVWQREERIRRARYKHYEAEFDLTCVRNGKTRKK